MAKPHKVQEPAAAYDTTKPPAQKTPATPAGTPNVRHIDEATARALAEKIFPERKKLLNKLAQ